MSDKDAMVKLGLHIEQDKDVPMPIIQIALDADTDILHVLATNYEGSPDGARAVSEILRVASDAIDAKLVREGGHGRGASQVGPTHKRFNPQPAGPRAEKAGGAR